MFDVWVLESGTGFFVFVVGNKKEQCWGEEEKREWVREGERTVLRL